MGVPGLLCTKAGCVYVHAPGLPHMCARAAAHQGCVCVYACMCVCVHKGVPGLLCTEAVSVCVHMHQGPTST